MAETARAASCGTGGKSEVYRRRRPERTVLHRLVRTHLETYLARAQEADPLGDGVPNFVEAQFRAYLRCGILAHGFARARCSGCGHDFLVAFSCKGRGICPSCNSRRMAATAARSASGGCPTDPFSIRDVLSHLDEPLRPPAVHPARGPPELELGFTEPSADGTDQTPAVDPSIPEPIPDHAPRGAHEMDQTRSW